MAMRETERSLRWYLILAGAYSCISALRSAWKAELTGAPVSWTLASWFMIGSYLVLGAAFVYAGLTLKMALANDPTWIKRMLIVTGVTLVVEVALHVALLGDFPTVIGMTTVHAAIRLAITAYLYVNVQRLSNAARADATGTVFE